MLLNKIVKFHPIPEFINLVAVMIEVQTKGGRQEVVIASAFRDTPM